MATLLSIVCPWWMPLIIHISTEYTGQHVTDCKRKAGKAGEAIRHPLLGEEVDRLPYTMGTHSLGCIS